MKKEFTGLRSLTMVEKHCPKRRLYQYHFDSIQSITEEIHLSVRWLSGSPITPIGFAVRVNL